MREASRHQTAAVDSRLLSTRSHFGDEPADPVVKISASASLPVCRRNTEVKVRCGRVIRCQDPGAEIGNISDVLKQASGAVKKAEKIIDADQRLARGSDEGKDQSLNLREDVERSHLRRQRPSEIRMAAGG